MPRRATVVKWTALVLYSAIIAAWVAAGAINLLGLGPVVERLVAGAAPESPILLVPCTFRYWVFFVVHFPPYVTYGLLLFMLALQALFLLGTGLKELARPLSRRRMVVPMFVFVLTAAMLLVALDFSLVPLIANVHYLRYGHSEASRSLLAGWR